MSRPDDIRLSFNEAASIYDEVRPTYPPAVFDDLFGLLPLRPQIVEVGPGTGQATRDLLRRGASVHAIEIGSAMAARLRANLPTTDLTVTVGDFEQVEIPEPVDSVFSATAYHWISPPAQTGRPASILRPGGLAAIVDLVQVDSPDDGGFFAAVQPICERYGEGHTGPPAPARDAVDPAIRARFEADPRFTGIEVRRYDWNQTYDADAYRKLMLSYSGTRMMGEADRHGLLDDIEAFVRQEFGGQVVRPLVVTLTTAERVG